MYACERFFDRPHYLGGGCCPEIREQLLHSWVKTCVAAGRETNQILRMKPRNNADMSRIVRNAVLNLIL